MDTAQHNERALREWFDTVGTVAVAVSGGVDSMTLAIVAGRALGGEARMYHAVSPAVPAEASERVRRYAELEGWQLTIVDAGEFAKRDLDPEFVKERQVLVTRGWRRLREIAGAASPLSLLDYPLPEFRHAARRDHAGD